MLGFSDRYTNSGAGEGQNCWFFNGTSTQEIGLTGTIYSQGAYQYSSAVLLDALGQVAGYSDLFSSSGSSLGTDGWFFDPATDQTTLLQFSVDSANGFSRTDPTFLTDTGVVLGTYELYNGSVDEGRHLFYWSEENGVSDLRIG